MANADTALFKPELVFFDMECKDREDLFPAASRQAGCHGLHQGYLAGRYYNS